MLRKLLILTSFYLLFFVSNVFASNYYWVGGHGNWSDLTHWATSSGGTILQTSLPDATSDVFIDQMSGFIIDDTLNIDLDTIWCHNFIMDSLPLTLYFKVTSLNYSYLEISGDIYIPSSTDWNFANSSSLSIGLSLTPADSSMSIYAPKTEFVAVSINGPAIVDMQSRMDVTGDMVFVGDDILFRTNNYDLNSFSVISLFPSNSSVDFGKSRVFLKSYLDIQAVTDSCHLSFKAGFPASLYQPLNVRELTIEPGASLTINSPLKAERVNAFGNLELTGSSIDSVGVFKIYNSVNCKKLVVDTINLNNGNWSFVFDSIAVNSNITSNTTPGQNISFGGFQSSYLFVNTDTVCLEFLNLSNVTALGTAIYYAGAFTLDGGGNNGWIFATCTPAVSNVWPGDVNNDLVVNNLDMLLLGNGYLQTGFARDSISIAFSPMVSFDWSSSYANGVNMKYGDCDGDGEIQFNDTLAVVNNYGLTHPAFIHNVNPFPLSGFGSELQLDLPQVLNTGVTYSIPILYGDGSLINKDLYGTAFTLLYDENIIDPLSISLDFPPSWLANTGESINFWKNNSSTGNVDVAITRFDGINANGFGQIGILNFTVLQNATGTPQFEFVRTLALLQNQSQVTLDVTPQQSGLAVGINENSAEESKLQLYPNPANDFIQCFITGKQNNSTIEIFNSLGERMNFENNLDNNQRKIDISSFPSGIYVVRLNVNNRIVSKSFAKF